MSDSGKKKRSSFAKKPDISELVHQENPGFKTVEEIEEPSEQQLEDLKRRFAVAYLKHNRNSFDAALEITSDTIQALRMADTWAMDPVVQKLIRELRDEFGEEHFMPTRLDLCKKVWDRLDEEGLDVSDFVRLSHHYAELRDFYPEKKGSITAVQVNTTQQGTVMTVIDHGTDEQWSQKLESNQAKLQDDLNNL